MMYTILARFLDFQRAPMSADDIDCLRYIEDGAMVVENGRIVAIGDRSEVIQKGEIIDHRPYLIMAGFIDLHLHMPQMQVIGSYAAQLLDWLNDHTFPVESQFSDPLHAKRIANELMDTLLRHGTTTSVAYCTSHPESVNAYFEAAQQRGMSVIGGKVMMDRGAPEALLDTSERSYEESKMLIEKWHGVDRVYYAITPRFAITSTPEQMEAAQALARENPQCYIQTHIDENRAEIDYTMSLYSKHADYMGVYEDYGLLGPKTLLGHCIHMNDREIAVMIESQSVAVHCPTSNLFLGSGLFDWFGLKNKGACVGLATDIGGGTSYSMMRTMDEAYKIQQLRGERLNPLLNFYTSTKGNAEAIGLEADIGDLRIGSSADFIVLDMGATPEMALRAERVENLQDELFLLQTMGDDRSIKETYVAGSKMKSVI